MRICRHARKVVPLEVASAVACLPKVGTYLTAALALARRLVLFLGSPVGVKHSGELASFYEKAASGAFSTEPITSYSRQELGII